MENKENIKQTTDQLSDEYKMGFNAACNAFIDSIISIQNKLNGVK